MIKRNLPLMITLAVFVLGYLYCLTQFPGFASTRVICNILTDNAFLGIIAVGMTFVILSGGIDLSVGSVIAFTGVFLAKAIGFWGISPLVAFPLVLVMGCAFGAFMGLLIDALKIPAFIITLAGMFFLRGVSYLVSEESIPINHPVYDTLSGLAWTIPGGGRLSAMGLLMLLVVVAGIFVAHRTRFGNQVYAIGGNATSANLMGISTRSATIRIYMLSTGLATLAGIVFSIYTQAGYALAGVGVELDAIASVVIGGTLLSGGVGTVLGTLFGVAIQGLIQTYINFDGTLSSWWTKIAIGILLFIFIALQRGLTVLWENRQNAAVTRVSGAGVADRELPSRKAGREGRDQASGNALMKFSTSSTMWLLPTKKERRWCRLSGIISRIRSLPSLALPPACSARKAIGLHSYSRRSLPSGWLAVLGYR